MPTDFFRVCLTRSSGIWDCQSSQAVVEFVRRGIAAKQDLHLICENMMNNCLSSNSETGGVGCDNATNAKGERLIWLDLLLARQLTRSTVLSAQISILDISADLPSAYFPRRFT